MDIGSFLLGLVPSIVISMVTFYIQRGQKQRDAISEQHRQAQREEALLSMELNMASAQLSYACAMAIKRGSPNGEVEEGIEVYNKAKSDYNHFLHKQGVEHIKENM